MVKRQTGRKAKSRRQRGQLVIEYILLLLVALGMAAILRSTMVGSGDDVASRGWLVKMWNSVVQAVAQDNPVDPI